VQKHQRRFGAMTQDLHELAHWLKQFEVTQVAIAYASHCTSLGRCATFSSNCSLFDPSIVSRHGLSVMDQWISTRVLIEVLILVVAKMGAHETDSAPSLQLLG
jgi:hypothetical protein